MLVPTRKVLYPWSVILHILFLKSIHTAGQYYKTVITVRVKRIKTITVRACMYDYQNPNRRTRKGMVRHGMQHVQSAACGYLLSSLSTDYSRPSGDWALGVLSTLCSLLSLPAAWGCSLVSTLYPLGTGPWLGCSPRAAGAAGQPALGTYVERKLHAQQLHMIWPFI